MSQVDLSYYVGGKEDTPHLSIAEIIVDTIQGENLIGTPAVFLRLAGCKVGCSFCDTTHIWKLGVSISVERLLDLFVGEGILARLERGHHLIITGGSPLLQQMHLVTFLVKLQKRCSAQFTTQIENEATIPASPALRELIPIWNNSPKLSNSGVLDTKRYIKGALHGLNRPQDYFKFVVSGEKDWKEIYDDFIRTGLVKKSQIVLMPLGKNRAEITAVQNDVVEMAIRHGVRYSPRLHVDLWDGADGV